MIRAHSSGHNIYFIDNEWKYEDDNTSVEGNERPCKRCGHVCTKEGYDACIGHIEGAISACCGHGVEEPYVMYEKL